MIGKLLINLILFLASLPVFAANEGPAHFSFEGRLYDQAGAPSTLRNVDFKVQVYDQNQTCILYEETFTKDLSLTNGQFSLTIGKGTPNSLYRTLLREALSSVEGDFRLNSCDYSVSAGDGRQIKILIDDKLGGPASEFAQTLSLGASAFALSADRLQGKAANDFVSINASANLTQAKIESLFNANGFTYLQQIAAGDFMKQSSTVGATLPSTTSDPIHAAPGSIWYDSNSKQLKFHNGTTVVPLSTGAGSVSSIATGAGLTGGPITATGTISIATGGVGTTQLADGGITGAKLAGDISISTSGSITTSGTLTADISSTRRTSTREVLLYDGVDNWLTLKASPTLATDYTLTLPPNEGLAGQVLSTSGSGTTSWTNTGTVTSVGLSLPGLFTVTNSPVTTAGTLSATLASQPAGVVFAGPATGTSSSAPTFRALTSADLPANAYDSSYARINGNSAGTAISLGTNDLNSLTLRTNSSTRMTITSSGLVGISTTNPLVALDVAGAIRVGSDAANCAAAFTGALRNNAGVLEFCNGTSWINYASAASALTSLNGLTSPTQLFSAGTGGTSPNWTTVSSNTHVLNLPLASTTGVTAGLISKIQFDAFNGKLSSALGAGNLWIGNSSGVATTVTPSGDVSVTTSGVFTTEKIRGIALDSGVTPTTAGQVLRFDPTGGGKWTPAFLSMADVRSTTGANPSIFPTTNCPLNQTMTWSSLTDAFVCQSISLPSSQIVYSSAAANLIFAGPASGGVATPAFRALTTADLPANAFDQTYFKQGGNSFGASATFGTNDANSLNFRTSGAQRMILTSDGNIGIGTASPGAAFDLYRNANTNAVIQVQNKNVGASATATFRTESDSGALSFGTTSAAAGDVSFLYATSPALNIMAQSGTGILAFFTGGTSSTNEHMRITASGNVGVGTTAPSTLFEVAGSATAHRYFATTGSVSSPAYSFSSATGLGLSSAGSNSLSLVTDSTERLRVTNSGAVGIGTTSPSVALEINGTGTLSAVLLPRESSLNRPSGTNGLIRYNTSLNKIEAYENGSWASFVSSAVPYLPLSGGTMTGPIYMNGSSLYGASSAGATLSIESTTNPNKGTVVINPNGGRVAIGTSSTSLGFEVFGGTTNAGKGANMKLAAQRSTAGEGGDILIIPGLGSSPSRNGFVGIGTSSPEATLHVNDSSSMPTVQIGGSSNSGTPTLSLVSGLHQSDISADTVGGLQIIPKNGNVNFYNGSYASTMTITNGGVSIGSSSPNIGAVLDLVATGGSNSSLVVPRGTTRPSGVNGMLRYNSSSNQFEFYQNGGWLALSGPSDRRLKTNIIPVPNALELADRMNPVYFDWDQTIPRAASNGTQHQVGFIAQELEEVLPEVVKKGGDTYRTVEYGQISAIAIGAIKELKARQDAVHGMCQAYDREIASLRAEAAQAKDEAAAAKNEVEMMKRYLCGKDPSAPWCK